MTSTPPDALTLFPPSRAEALERLARFLPHAGRDYAATRNADHGPGRRENVSTLSPYIRRRLLTEEEVVAAVLRRHSFQAAEKFVQEAFWRTYWKGWLELRPAVHERYMRGLARALAEMRDSDRLRARYDAATAGATGIEGFDDWARELVATGYLHNHARMWFASIWIFTLRLPWELGADFFMRHLLDGDPASNTLSWRWVGGLQTQGKTYLARADNIARYTDGRFSPKGLAETAHPPPPEPHPPPRPLPPPDAPPEGPVALLVTEEDCFVETLDFGRARVSAIGIARTSEGLSPAIVSEHVHAFAQGALDDAAARASARFDAPAHGVPLTAGALADLARGAGADTIVTAYPPVGPTAEALSRLEPALAEEGVRLVRVMRPFDARAWPHATRGFFQFRERIPVLIAQGGLA
ncbi:MAG: deoxyribodipyrimidine photolyase [Microvirga sp.]|nr:deoxyribodipyrimidine photolyase [Microvirga sp.]